MKKQGMNRAKILANNFASEQEYPVSVLWYSDGLIVVTTLSAAVQNRWVKSLGRPVVEHARSDDGSVGVIILNQAKGFPIKLPERAFEGGFKVLTDEVQALAQLAGHNVMFKDNRQRDHNTIDLYVDLVKPKPKVRS